MFLRLMQESIAELKGEPIIADLEPEINVNLTAYLPADYMPDIDQRLSSYRRLAEMNDLKELAEFKREISDRFGAPPQEANNLLVKIMLKIMAIRAGVKRLDVRDGHLFLYFSPAHQKTPTALITLVEGGGSLYRFTPDHVLRVRLTGAQVGAAAAEIKNILKDISMHVNN